MRVVICPDKFAGTLSAVEAASAIAEGWRAVAPDDEIVLRPIADGGPGFVEVLHTALGGSLVHTRTTDPLGRPVEAQVLIAGDTAYIESAQATGLHHLTLSERDPMLTTSRGLGKLITTALSYGVKRVIIGLGGSGTNDGGAGMLAMLGLFALDAEGRPLLRGGELGACTTLRLPAAAADQPGERVVEGGDGSAGPGVPGHQAQVAAGAGDPAHDGPGGDVASAADGPGGSMAGAAGRRNGMPIIANDPDPARRDQQGIGSRLTGSGSRPLVGGLAGVEIIGASDVDNPLTGAQGASAVYGPQKGATAEDVELLDQALANWARVLERDLPSCPAGLAEKPGGGAAGGLGAAILALGGRIVSGIDLIRDLTGLDQAIAGAGVVITGEGSFDHQSLRGKVIAGVAAAARDEGIPCVVLAGRVTTGRREQGAAGVTEAHSLTDHFGSTEQAMSEPARGLRELAERVARQYS